ncbi:MAG: threonine synthase [Aquificaceae bacterium]
MRCWQGIIKEYAKFLPVESSWRVVTLLEGNTPLVEAFALAKEAGFRGRLFLKCEGLNPTGSFKDRGMTVAITKALNEGKKAVICASTGNTSASAAAYAARAGMKAFVLLPRGAVAMGKLSQAVMYGARVIALQGTFDDALSVVRKIAEILNVEVVNSVNPLRIEGQKTAAFEVCDELGMAPDFHFLPVGNAGNITAYWKGYKEYYQAGIIDKLPKMMGFQAEGAAPIVKGYPVKNPQTVATAIKIGNPYSWQSALNAVSESEGFIGAVSDDEILRAYKLIASLEGVFCEPASAASVAGFLKLCKKGFFRENQVVVCTLTGSGLKDPQIAMDISEKPVSLAPDVDVVIKELGF